MRYFKCEKEFLSDTTVLQQTYEELNSEDQCAVRRRKRWHKAASATFVTVSAVCLIGFSFLIVRIPDFPFLWLNILKWIGSVLLFLLALLGSLLIGGLVSAPLFSKAEKGSKADKQQLLSKACLQLREYYGLNEPCLVTKCYEASDKRFKNHDICLFAVGDELRMTTNLLHGFFDSAHDLGCYAFTAQEIVLSSREINERSATEIAVGETVFLLGKRALPFVRTFQQSYENTNQTVKES